MSRRELRITCRRAEVLLDAYLDDDLPGRRRTALEAHLAGCFSCTQELQRARVIRDGLRALPERFLGDHVTDAVLSRVRGERRETPVERPWGQRIGDWLTRRLVPAWPPVAAVAGVTLLVLGAMHLLTRPPVDKPITSQDVARAETQVRWVMAHLGDINRRTAVKVRDDVLGAGVADPAARAVATALDNTPRQ